MPNTQNLATVGVTNRQDTDNIIVEQGGNIRRVQYEDIKTDILRGDAADGTISTFEESAEEFPIPAPATPQKTLWGRIKKFCSDFNDWKTGVMLFGHLVNNAESDSDTLPLAASVAKLLQEQITTNAGAIATLNSELQFDNVTKTIFGVSTEDNPYITLLSSKGERRKITIVNDGMYYGYNESNGTWHDLWNIIPGVNIPRIKSITANTINEMFTNFSERGDVPVIGVINYTSPIAPDGNTCFVFLMSYMALAISYTGKIFAVGSDGSSWVQKN